MGSNVIVTMVMVVVVVVALVEARPHGHHLTASHIHNDQQKNTLKLSRHPSSIPPMVNLEEEEDEAVSKCFKSNPLSFDVNPTKWDFIGAVLSDLYRHSTFDPRNEFDRYMAQKLRYRYDPEYTPRDHILSSIYSWSFSLKNDGVHSELFKTISWGLKTTLQDTLHFRHRYTELLEIAPALIEMLDYFKISSNAKIKCFTEPETPGSTALISDCIFPEFPDLDDTKIVTIFATELSHLLLMKCIGEFPQIVIPRMDYEFSADATHLLYLAAANDGCRKEDFYPKQVAQAVIDYYSSEVRWKSQLTYKKEHYRTINKHINDLFKAEVSDEALATSIHAITSRKIPNVFRTIVKAITDKRMRFSEKLRSKDAGLMRAWLRADEYMRSLALSDDPIEVDHLLRLNAMVISVDGERNSFRTEQAQTPGCKSMDCTYIAPEFIPKAMQGVVEQLNTMVPRYTDVDPRDLLHTYITLANDMLVYLSTLHPFKDGNGRTNKLIADMILMKGRLPPAYWEGHYALFPGLIYKNTQSGAEWKQTTLVRSFRNVANAVVDLAYY